MRPSSIDQTRVIPQPMTGAVTRWIQKYPAIPLDAFQWADAFCLATGVYAPLGGFQGHRASKSILETWHLPTGEIWPIPITLGVDPKLAATLRKTDLARLIWQNETVAVLHVDEVYWLDPEDEAMQLYGTKSALHPGARRMLNDSPVRVAGSVTLVQWPAFSVTPVLTPRELQTLIQERGWHKIVGFQTRNPLHRAHEYIQKLALESHDALIVHPLIGYTKSDDVPVDVRWQSYQALLGEYFPKDRAVLTGFPAPMRYAGPREAVLHALCRKNYGMTHFIVGRDHAGVADFYHPMASQRIFERFPASELGITIIPAEPAFYCYRCQQMATNKTCPHDAPHHEVLSGTRTRSALVEGKSLPIEAIRPEVMQILRAYYLN